MLSSSSRPTIIKVPWISILSLGFSERRLFNSTVFSNNHPATQWPLDILFHTWILRPDRTMKLRPPPSAGRIKDWCSWWIDALKLDGH
jgi:hypothetical protein